MTVHYHQRCSLHSHCHIYWHRCPAAARATAPGCTALGCHGKEHVGGVWCHGNAATRSSRARGIYLYARLGQTRSTPHRHTTQSSEVHCTSVKREAPQAAQGKQLVQLHATTVTPSLHFFSLHTTSSQPPPPPPRYSSQPPHSVTRPAWKVASLDWATANSNHYQQEHVCASISALCKDRKRFRLAATTLGSRKTSRGTTCGTQRASWAGVRCMHVHATANHAMADRPSPCMAGGGHACTAVWQPSSRSCWPGGIVALSHSSQQQQRSHHLLVHQHRVWRCGLHAPHSPAFTTTTGRSGAAHCCHNCRKAAAPAGGVARKQTCCTGYISALVLPAASSYHPSWVGKGGEGQSTPCYRFPTTANFTAVLLLLIAWLLSPCCP